MRIWAATALALLVIVLWLHNSYSSDAEVLLVYGMLVLSFPLGLLLPAAMSGLVAMGVSSPDPSIALFFTEWLIFLILGWIQWSKVVPWAWRSVRDR